jgi:ribonuclease HI
MDIEVWSDGSGNTFDSDGGCGWRIIIDGEVKHDGSCYLPSATNNVAEITAGINGLDFIKQQRDSGLIPMDAKITLVCDSQLVLGYASGRYKCKALHLTQLYIKLRQLYKELNCETRWVRGHSGDPNNEACDRLAKAAREGKGLCQVGQSAIKSTSENIKDNIDLKIEKKD